MVPALQAAVQARDRCWPDSGGLFLISPAQTSLPGMARSAAGQLARRISAACVAHCLAAMKVRVYWFVAALALTCYLIVCTPIAVPDPPTGLLRHRSRWRSRIAAPLAGSPGPRIPGWYHMALPRPMVWPDPREIPWCTWFWLGMISMTVCCHWRSTRATPRTLFAVRRWRWSIPGAASKARCRTGSPGYRWSGETSRQSSSELIACSHQRPFR